MDKLCADINKNATDSDRYMKIISDIKVEAVDKEFSNNEQEISPFEQVYLDSVTEGQKLVVQNLKAEEVMHAHKIDIKEGLCILEDNGTVPSKQLQFIKEETDADNEISNFTHDFKQWKEEIKYKDRENFYGENTKLPEDILKNISIHQSVSRIFTDSNSRDIADVASQSATFYTASKTEDYFMNTKESSTLKEAKKHTVDIDSCGSVDVISTISISQQGSLKRCKLCDFVSGKKSRLKIHMLTHRDLPQIKCSKCDKSFTKITLREHFKLFHSDSFECAKCRSVFSTSGLLKDHMFQDINCAEWKCLECNHIFSNATNYNRHMLKHSNRHFFTCSECNQHFSTKKHLKNHMLTHIKSDFLKCLECNQHITSQLCMEQHLLKHADPNRLMCLVCDKTFHYKSTLKEHVLRHINPVLFKCSKCDKHFSRRYLLKAHRLVHSDPDIHKCLECGIRFSAIRYLKVHKLKHCNPKIFTCQVCNMSFSRQDALKRHMLVHANTDKLKC